MKMKELLLDNDFPCTKEESEMYIETNRYSWYWRVIDNIGWFYLARDYGKNAKDKVSEYLINNSFSIDEIIDLHNFIVSQREIVKNFIQGFLRGCNSEEKRKYRLNDDGTWDLASHIVGMGKVVMDLVFRKPEIIFILQNIKQENFEYGFDAAIYELQKDNFS